MLFYIPTQPGLCRPDFSSVGFGARREFLSALCSPENKHARRSVYSKTAQYSASDSCKPLQEAYKCYVRAYDSHSLKNIFDVNTLDLVAVAKSFGFSVPPFVDLPISNKPKVRHILLLW